MLLQKKGFPHESELVLCTVTKIYHTSIFVHLDEYNNSVGMINISEIAPGRIRNLRDYVQEGKKVVCKVLKVNERRGHIDLSYRRVNDNQRRKKIEEIKQEQKAEKLIEDVAKTLKTNVKVIFNEIYSKLEKDYDNVYNFFMDVRLNEIKVEDYIKKPKLAQELKNLISKRIKPPVVEIKGEITLYSKASDGLNIIKEILKDIIDEHFNLVYEAGGKYKIKVKSQTYKDAELILKNKLDIIKKKHKKIMRNILL